MTKPQIIETPAGERLVVLPVAEYERLIEAAEDLLDIATADAAKAALACGQDELLPASLVDRILSGENPVRVWREYRGIDVEQLAHSSGVPEHDLRAIEGGAAPAAPDVAARLAVVLRVDPDDLT